MHLNEWDIEREPVGWFHFEEASQFNTLPEIFVRFVQQHLRRTDVLQKLFFPNYHNFQGGREGTRRY